MSETRILVSPAALERLRAAHAATEMAQATEMALSGVVAEALAPNGATSWTLDLATGLLSYSGGD